MKAYSYRYFTLVISLLVPLAACSKKSPTGPGIEPPTVPPVTPPDPTPAPKILTSVADIKASGAIGNEVLVAGRLTSTNNRDEDEYWFNDGTDQIVMDFPSDHVPGLNELILVWGTVDSGPEIDVIQWALAASIPPEPVDPPVTPPDPTPPTLVITKVSDILAGNAPYEVILAGQLTRQDGNDDDEWWFTDGTGEVVLDFPSGHRPAVGAPIYVWGKTSSSEIDVIAWQPR